MKVLVPYDGAELSEQAAVMAIELLAQHHLDLSLLRVASDDAHVFDAGTTVEKAAARLGGSPATVTPLLSVGSAAQEIVRCADRHGVELIAMSTHGRSDLARMLVGSVTDRVIRTSPVPVLVLHPPTMSIDRMSPPSGRKLRVLVPLDGSASAEEAARMAVSLLNPRLIEVSLVTVVGTSQREMPQAHGILELAAVHLGEHGVDVSTTVLEGEAANQIAAFAVDGAYDLIVMATHGHSLLARALMGSTTDRVVRISEVPVLVVQSSSEAYSGRRLDRPTGLPSANEGMAVGSTGEMAMVPPTLPDA
jgi:nucleotide-binding universal stress UspA family protein